MMRGWSMMKWWSMIKWVEHDEGVEHELDEDGQMDTHIISKHWYKSGHPSYEATQPSKH